MCVFIQEQYIQLLSLLIHSIFINGNINKSDTDILIITSPAFKELIQSELDKYDMSIKYYTLTLNTIMEASCCKLNIFDYTDVNIYKKILYIDTDVLINSDVNPLFNLNIVPDKIYAVEEGTIGGSFWGIEFFDYSKFNSSLRAFNAGVLFFYNRDSIKALFNDIRLHIQTYLKNNKIPPSCLDQPFIVYNAITKNMYDNQLLKSYIQLDPNPNNRSDTMIIYHFLGGPGDYTKKLIKMKNYSNKYYSCVPPSAEVL
jgi:lipopolysaccharide biosynthesis glycosyltransferase